LDLMRVGCALPPNIARIIGAKAFNE
jgi:hypothetical protein